MRCLYRCTAALHIISYAYYHLLMHLTVITCNPPLGNTCGAVAGIVGPIVVSACVDAWPGLAGWRVAFLFTFGLCSVATMVWFRFIKAEIVPVLNTPASLDSDAL